MKQQVPQASATKRSRMPHVIVILFAMLAAAVIATYLLPAGQYERVISPSGVESVVPETYQTLNHHPPVSILDMLKSIFQGMVEVSDIIFYMLIVGGAFEVIRASEAIDAAVGRLTLRLSGKEHMLIPALMILFAIGGSVIALAEEAIPYITLLLPIMIRLGFDSITAAAVVLLGTGAGFTTAIMNPFTIGVAQNLADVPMFSGAGFRIIMGICFATLNIFFVMRYAAKVKRDPSLRCLPADYKAVDMNAEPIRLKPRHIVILITIMCAIILLMTGVIKWGWSLAEISALFVGLAILIGFISRLSASGIAESFVQGCTNIAMGALIVGLARAILIVLREGGVMDTILYGLVSMLDVIPSAFTAIGMFAVQSIMSFLVPSGSGQAALTMPIMVPLSDMVDITRQTAVLAYQLGDGISNVITPTSGYFMAGLALAGIPWTRWIRWMLPLFLMQYALGALFITIAHFIGYQ